MGLTLFEQVRRKTEWIKRKQAGGKKQRCAVAGVGFCGGLTTVAIKTAERLAICEECEAFGHEYEQVVHCDHGPKCKLNGRPKPVKLTGTCPLGKW